MEQCDVLIVGGGPAGASCAWALTRAGFHVIVADRACFPRDKACAGWITPLVLETLQIEPSDYGSEGRTIQPITGFRTGLLGCGQTETRYQCAVSYGIRRWEFDNYLLRRSGAHLITGTPVRNLRRVGRHWVADDRISAPMLVGAGGHFCPVARFVNNGIREESVVAAQEVEFPLDTHGDSSCSVDGNTPELYLCRDLRGYGWCFRKNGYVNIGLGRFGGHHLVEHVQRFAGLLRERGKLRGAIPCRWRGHAYLLYGTSSRRITGDGVLLIGDAAGLAHPLSGEGIRTAVESGLLAAETIRMAKGDFRGESLEPFASRVQTRFGVRTDDGRLLRRLPGCLVPLAARTLLASRSFTRHVMLDKWFLHADQRPLLVSPALS